uniref:Uncharacterized protein n=1 Tax=Neospora caninum (strain Liverpool) TaxID=572307 RepID=A0A0F7UIX7_NEOCL|nr:TPA: hypothetical protein BN1204_057105 [Neospora caninum Liverpool]
MRQHASGRDRNMASSAQNVGVVSCHRLCVHPPHRLPLHRGNGNLLERLVRFAVDENSVPNSQLRRLKRRTPRTLPFDVSSCVDSPASPFSHPVFSLGDCSRAHSSSQSTCRSALSSSSFYRDPEGAETSRKESRETLPSHPSCRSQSVRKTVAADASSQSDSRWDQPAVVFSSPMMARHAPAVSGRCSPSYSQLANSFASHASSLPPATCPSSLSPPVASRACVSSQVRRGLQERDDTKSACRSVSDGGAVGGERLDEATPYEERVEPRPHAPRQVRADSQTPPGRRTAKRERLPSYPPSCRKRLVALRASVTPSRSATRASTTPRSSSVSPPSSSLPASGGGLLLLHLARLALLALSSQKRARRSRSRRFAALNSSPKRAGRRCSRPESVSSDARGAPGEGGVEAEATEQSLAARDRHRSDAGSARGVRCRASQRDPSDAQRRCVGKREEGEREPGLGRGRRKASAANRQKPEAAHPRRRPPRNAESGDPRLPTSDRRDDLKRERNAAGGGTSRSSGAARAAVSDFQVGTEKERWLTGHKTHEKGDGCPDGEAGGLGSEIVGCGATIKDIGDYLCEHLHQTDSPSFRTNLSRFLRECTDGTLIRQVRRGVYALTARAAASSVSNVSPLRVFKRSLWRSLPLSTGDRTEAVLRLKRELQVAEESARAEGQTGYECGKGAHGKEAAETPRGRRKEETDELARDGERDRGDGGKGDNKDPGDAEEERKEAGFFMGKNPGEEQRREVEEEARVGGENREERRGRRNGNVVLGHKDDQAIASATQEISKILPRLNRKSKAEPVEEEKAPARGPPQDFSPPSSSFSSVSVSLRSSSSSSLPASSCSLATPHVSSCISCVTGGSPSSLPLWGASPSRQPPSFPRSLGSLPDNQANAFTLKPPLRRRRNTETSRLFPPLACRRLRSNRNMKRLPTLSSREGFLTLQKKVRNPARAACYLLGGTACDHAQDRRAAEAAEVAAALVAYPCSGTGEETPVSWAVGGGARATRLVSKLSEESEGQRRGLRSPKQEAEKQPRAEQTEGEEPKKARKRRANDGKGNEKEREEVRDKVEAKVKREKRRKCENEEPTNGTERPSVSKKRGRPPKPGRESKRGNTVFHSRAFSSLPASSGPPQNGVVNGDARSRDQRRSARATRLCSSLPPSALWASAKHTERQRGGYKDAKPLGDEAGAEPGEAATQARRTGRRRTVTSTKRVHHVRREDDQGEKDGRTETAEGDPRRVGKHRSRRHPSTGKGCVAASGDGPHAFLPPEVLLSHAVASERIFRHLEFSPKNENVEAGEERRDHERGGDTGESVHGNAKKVRARMNGKREVPQGSGLETETGECGGGEAAPGKEAKNKERWSEGETGGGTETGQEKKRQKTDRSVEIDLLGSEQTERRERIERRAGRQKNFEMLLAKESFTKTVGKRRKGHGTRKAGAREIIRGEKRKREMKEWTAMRRAA